MKRTPVITKYALVIAALLVLSACAGDAATRAQNALNVACNTYDAALVDMTVMLRSGRLSLPQAERFNVIRLVASPICINKATAPADALAKVEAQLLALSALRQEVK